MGHDEDFARTLRHRLDSVAPIIDVQTARVVPRARRRRAAGRGMATLALAGVVAGGGWAAQAMPWNGSEPTGPAMTDVADAPAPSAEPTQTADPERGVAPSEPAAVEGDVPAGWYWYVRTQYAGPKGERVTEQWMSRELPGLVVYDGDLTTPTAVGPRNVVGRFMIDGEWVDMLRDPALLPTDPAGLEAVFRASVEPDRRNGTPDDKVFGMVHDLLLQGGLIPADLRKAAWTVAAGLPSAVTSSGADRTGRPGEIMEYTEDGSVARYVRDPGTGLLLEIGAVLMEQRAVPDVPVQPTLEMSGCTRWETC